MFTFVCKMARQGGLERYKSKQKYFDILLLGNTRQGKSTTAEKLIIANPEGLNYDQHPEHVSNDTRVMLQDISRWILYEDDDTEKFKTHLEYLTSARSRKPPHLTVFDERTIGGCTGCCEVLSNETTKVRVMDLPGFNDSTAYQHSKENELHKSYGAVASFNMDVTRNVIRIQSALGIRFNRVLYFLPVRGPLERDSADLKSELEQLNQMFGRPVFDSMIAIATVPENFSIMIMPDQAKLTPKGSEMCKKFLTDALKDVLDVQLEEVPEIPIILISLSDTCEIVLDKIKKTDVTCDQLALLFNPGTCTLCGTRVQHSDEGIMFEDSPSSTVSRCHPKFKYSLLHRTLGDKVSRFVSRKFPAYKEESCVKCNKRPLESGCLEVGSEYNHKGSKCSVDHTSIIIEPEDDHEYILGTADNHQNRTDQLVDEYMLGTADNHHEFAVISAEGDDNQHEAIPLQNLPLSLNSN